MEGNSQSIGNDQGRNIVLSISFLKLSNILSNGLDGTIGLLSGSSPRFLSLEELIEIDEEDIILRL